MFIRKESEGRWIASTAVAVVCAVQLVFWPAISLAATNQATGNIAGDATALSGSNTITLTTTTLNLVKAAFLANGTQVASGSSLAKGTVVKFLLYIDNTTSAAADSVNVTDVLAATFAYQAGTIKADTSQATGAAVAAIYTAANAAATLTDAVSAADLAGYTAGTTTISAGQTAGNAKVIVPAGKVWALLFTTKMQ
jgi:hypothetical protein